MAYLAGVAELNRFIFAQWFFLECILTFEMLLQVGTQFKCVGKVIIFVFLFFFDRVFLVAIVIAGAVRIGVTFELFKMKNWISFH